MLDLNQTSSAVFAKFLHDGTHEGDLFSSCPDEIMKGCPGIKRIVFTTQILWLLTACQEKSPLQHEADALLNEATELQAQLHLIHSRLDSLWDTTTLFLTKSIPADFPPIDKDIFLQARNASHIMMFSSFYRLEPEVRSMVAQAGKMDSIYAREMYGIHHQLDALEKEKNQFLAKVYAQEPARYKVYRERFVNIQQPTPF